MKKSLLPSSFVAVLLAIVPYVGVVAGISTLIFSFSTHRRLRGYTRDNKKVVVAFICSGVAIGIGSVSSFYFTSVSLTQTKSAKTITVEPTIQPTTSTFESNQNVVIETQTGTTSNGYPAEGLYNVPDELSPGLYYNVQGATYFERLSGTSGSTDEIIANVSVNGPAYVQILSEDVAFYTEGEGVWKPFNRNLHDHALLETFSDGMYLLSIDVAPGVYVAKGEGYVEFLSSVDGNVESVIDGTVVKDGDEITLEATYDAFKTSNGIVWTKK